MGTRMAAVCALLAIVMGARPALADEAVEDVVTVVLNAGERFEATIVRQDEATITFRTATGHVRTIDRRLIAYVVPPFPGAPLPPTVAAVLTDPSDTRLMLAETGRRLGKGDGYFYGSYALTEPRAGVAYGLTDHLSVSGGLSSVPDSARGGDQSFYAAAKVGWKLSKDTAFSVGGQYVAEGRGDGDIGGDEALLIAVATFGPPSRSLSVGAALRASQEPELILGADHEFRGITRRWRAHQRPLLFVGGTVRLGRRASLVAESWFFSDRLDASELPLGLALRIFGWRVSVDVGIVSALAFLGTGYPPLPWVSLTFHFGPSRAEAKRPL